MLFLPLLKFMIADLATPDWRERSLLENCFASSWGMRLQIAFPFSKLTKEQQKMMMEQRLKQMEQEPQKK